MKKDEIRVICIVSRNQLLIDQTSKKYQYFQLLIGNLG